MTTLASISASQAQKEVTANENFIATSAAGLFGRRYAGISGLTWAYYGGILYVDGVATAIADGTVALTNSATNYIETTRAGVVSANTTAFTAGRIPLYTAVTSGGAITSYTDYREFNQRFSRGRVGITVTSADVTLSAAQALCDEIKATGTLTGNRNVIVPTVAGWWLVDNQTSGAYTLTVKTTAGTGVAIPQGYRTIVYCDGTNVLEAVTGFPGNISVGGNAVVSGTLTVSGATITTGSTTALSLATTAGTVLTCNNSGDIAIAATKKIFLDGTAATGNTYLYEVGADIISFVGGGTERARITAGGYFKASNSGTYGGSTAAYHEFYKDTDTATLALAITCAQATNTNAYGVAIGLVAAPNDTTRYFLRCGDGTDSGIGAGTERATIRSNGGLANYQANNVDLCDITVKRSITDSPDYTDMVERLSYKHFRYKDAQADDFTDNITAQDIEELAPELVGEWSGGLKSVMTYRLQQRINSVVPRLIKRIKALEARA